MGMTKNCAECGKEITKSSNTCSAAKDCLEDFDLCFTCHHSIFRCTSCSIGIKDGRTSLQLRIMRRDELKKQVKKLNAEIKELEAR